jgi:hypothetical protein
VLLFVPPSFVKKGRMGQLGPRDIVWLPLIDEVTEHYGWKKFV